MDTTTAVISPQNKIESFLQRKPVIMQLLRFGAIGVLNTALDFLVLNFISKTLGVTSGLKLGSINVVGFVLALIQSYLWNKYWAFGGSEQAVSLFKNFIRLVLVGLLGFVAMVLVLLGAKSAPASYFLIVLAIYLIFEVVLWQAFGLSKNISKENQQKFISFTVVSLVGLVINSALLALISQRFSLVGDANLNKNLAKIIATGASLVWNFVGYKLMVFKK